MATSTPGTQKPATTTKRTTKRKPATAGARTSTRTPRARSDDATAASTRRTSRTTSTQPKTRVEHAQVLAERAVLVPSARACWPATTWSRRSRGCHQVRHPHQTSSASSSATSAAAPPPATASSARFAGRALEWSAKCASVVVLSSGPSARTGAGSIVRYPQYVGISRSSRGQWARGSRDSSQMRRALLGS